MVKPARAPPDDDEAIDALSQEDREEYDRFLGLLDQGDLCIGPIDNRRVGREQLTFKPQGKASFSGTTWNPAIVPLLIRKAQEMDQWKPSPPKKDAAGELRAEVEKAASNTALAKFSAKAIDDFPLLKKIVSNASWYSDAMNEIGFSAMLMGMQVGKFDPKEAALQIAEFRDEDNGKERFIEFVNKRLATLWEAHENGGRIFELEKQLKATTGKFLLSEIARHETEKVARELNALVNTMKANMCADDLRKVIEVRGFGKLMMEMTEEEPAAPTQEAA